MPRARRRPRCLSICHPADAFIQRRGASCALRSPGPAATVCIVERGFNLTVLSLARGVQVALRDRVMSPTHDIGLSYLSHVDARARNSHIFGTYQGKMS